LESEKVFESASQAELPLAKALVSEKVLVKVWARASAWPKASVWVSAQVSESG
jgi:hypothetical protein